MDAFGTLPNTLEELSQRLKRGEIFSLQRSDDSFDYALFLDKEGHIILRQGSVEQPFRMLEVAVLTLLNCIGEFSSLESAAPTALPIDERGIDPRLLNLIVEVFNIEPDRVEANISFADLDLEGFGLDLLDLVVRLEELFGITISDDDAIAHMKTVGGTQQYLMHRGVL